MVLADSDSLKGLLDVFISISEGINVFIKAIDKLGVTFPTLLGLIGGVSSGFKAFNGGIDVASKNGDKFGLSLDGVKNTLSKGVVPAISSFVKQGLLIGGVTLAVQTCAWGWDKLTNGVKNTAKELNEAEEGILSNISSQNEKIKILQTTGVEYEKLANKAKRTKEEEEEMIRLGNDLAKILPEMTIGYDEEGNAILSMTDDMQGLINKTKEAIEQQDRLLLGNRIEQSDTALKLLTKGEGFGKDSLGLLEQKANVQKEYNKTMKDLQEDYMLQLENVRNFEGKNREIALQNARKIRNDMIVAESKYMTEYSAIQSRILEQSNIFRDEMNSTWRDSANYLTEELGDDLESSITKFTNAMDFSEINSEQELESVRRIFRELPKLAQSGAVDIEEVSTKISNINKEFAKTGDLKAYNKSMQDLAKTVSGQTGWDASVLEEMFTTITDGSLQGAATLDTFLKSYGKTVEDIKNGDSLAKALQEQYNAIETAINSITTHDFKNSVANYQLRVNLQTDEDLPKQVRETIDKMVKLGLDDTEVITVTGEVLMALKDGKIDKGETEVLREQLYNALESELSGKELELTVEGILKSFNSKEILKDIESSLGDKEVTKTITAETHGEEKLKAFEESVKLLTERDLYTKLQAVMEGDEDVIYFAQIVKNLPASKQSTYDFIFENKQALSELKSYEEVIEYIKANPQLIQKYNIDAPNLELTTKQYKELNKVVEGTNGQEVNIETNGDDVLKTIEDVESLIKISAKVEEGKYKIDIDANTQAAIDNINSLKDSVNNLNKELGSGKSISYKAETAQAAKNISGLITRVNEIKKLTGKTFKYYSDTAGAAKNISGLITRVNQIKKLNGKTFKYYADTAQAAKNISGLITRIDQVNSRKGKTFTWSANTAQAAKNISGLIDRIDQINGKRSKTFSYTVKTKEVKQSLEDDTPAIPDVAPASMVSPISTVADEIASQTSSIQANLRAGVGEINSFSSNMARARTISTPLAIQGYNIRDTLKYSIELLQELENRISKVNNEISLLDKKMENAVGTTKITYLQQQNALYKEQADIQRELHSNLQKQHNYYKYYLQQKGFSFNADGNLTNYEEKLLAMEKELARLEAKADKASDKYNSYTGDNEKTKNSLKSTYDAAKKKADDYADSLSEIKKFLDAYLDVTFTEMPNAVEEWQELQNAIAENNREIENLNRENKLYKFNNAIKEVETQIDSLSDKLDILSIKMELEGTDSKHIQQYINLLQQQQNLQQSLINNYKSSMGAYQDDLRKYGFSFDQSGQVTNLDETLNKHQNSSDLEHINSILDEYLSLIGDKLPDAEKELLNITLSITEQQKALEELVRTQKLEPFTNKILELNEALESTSNELDMISSKLEYAYGKDKLKLLDQQIEKYKEQQKIQQELIDQYKAQMDVYQSELFKYGFNFGSDGSVLNIASVLGNYKGEGLEYVKNLLQEYLDIQNGDLPDAEKAWQDLDNAIKDTLKNQLDTTKDIEGKITDIYKKQIEERIKALNKETDAKLKALKKQQDAYNKYREEVDYKEEYDEKLAEVLEIQKQLDIAMKDSSLNGQKKVQELQKELAAAQKELQKLTQDKIDQNINDMFDKEAERLEEENNKAIENLENTWSDSKIAEMVAQALGSGVFTDIEGNVHSLEDVLVDFAEESGELFGVLGSIIESELITNLQIAKDTVRELSTIMSEFDLVGYTSTQISRSIQGVTSRMANSGTYATTNNNNINITSPIINIEGNVDSNVVEELKQISEKIKTDVIDTIARSIR